jgi:cell division protein FtsB
VNLQIAKLELETNNLNEEYARLKRSIEAREAEMNEQEAIAEKCRRDFEALKIERGELQDVRK